MRQYGKEKLGFQRTGSERGRPHRYGFTGEIVHGRIELIQRNFHPVQDFQPFKMVHIQTYIDIVERAEHFYVSIAVYLKHFHMTPIILVFVTGRWVFFEPLE